MKVKCIETGCVYNVFHVQEPSIEMVGYKKGPKVGLEQKLYSITREISGYYFIEDDYGNIAGKLAFEDAKIVE